MTENYDPYNLQRFVDAQNDHNTYDEALFEIRNGGKQSHWIWFVFPQLRGLGTSAMSQKYAIPCLASAKAYLNHGILHDRLIEMTEAVMSSLKRFDVDIVQLLGEIDAEKFRSCMTLFWLASDDTDIGSIDRRVFCDAINGALGGKPCRKTMRLLGIATSDD